jgi:hypothetical protein
MRFRATIILSFSYQFNGSFSTIQPLSIMSVTVVLHVVALLFVFICCALVLLRLEIRSVFICFEFKLKSKNRKTFSLSFPWVESLPTCFLFLPHVAQPTPAPPPPSFLLHEAERSIQDFIPKPKPTLRKIPNNFDPFLFCAIFSWKPTPSSPNLPSPL